jgi:hypothetical protein
MQDDPVAAAEQLARAVIMEHLGSEAVAAFDLRIETYLAPRDGEPLLCVNLAPAGADAEACRGSAFQLRLAPTPERFAWMVRESTRSALQQLGRF